MAPTLITSLIALTFTGLAAAQTSPTLAGCYAVDCPGSGNTACEVAGYNYDAVGVTAVSNDSTNLTWTIARQEYDNVNATNSTERYFEETFYLGAAPSANLDSTCAIILTDAATNNSVFYDLDNDNSRADIPAACTGQTSAACIDALTSRTQSLAAASNASCASIASALQSEGLPSACNVADPVRAHAVDLSAVQPITAAQNASSTCWPTLPKSNDLSRVYAFNVTASLYFNRPTVRALRGSTPLLNVFGVAGGDDADVELLCMRIVALNQNQTDSQIPGAGGRVGAWLTGVFAGVLGVVAILMA